MCPLLSLSLRISLYHCLLAVCLWCSVQSLSRIGLSDPVDCTPGFPVHHQLPELTQTQVHRVGDAFQPSDPLSSPLFPTSVFPSIRVFSNESVLSIRRPKNWSFSISPSNENSGLISYRMDWLDLFAVLGDSKESSPTVKNINSSALSFLYSRTLTSIHDYWKN